MTVKYPVQKNSAPWDSKLNKFQKCVFSDALGPDKLVPAVPYSVSRK
jgi:hypothetical protein